MTQDADRPSGTEEPQKRSTLTSVILCAAVTGAMILNVSSTSSTNIAVPSIAKDLKFPADQVQWLVSAFSLSAGCLLLLFGRIADLFGRKLVFMAGCIWIMAFSLGCGFSQDRYSLIVLRALHGLGPAATIPAGLGILAQSFHGPARSLAFATFAAGAPMGGALGNVIGGLIVQYTSESWRAVFWFTSGLSAVVAIMGWFTIDKDEPSHITDRRVDWIGAFLITSGLVLVTFTLGEANTAKPSCWSSPHIIALLVLGVILIALFFLWERHLQNNTRFPPLMPLNIWTRSDGKTAAMFFIGFFTWCCFNSWSFWATLYYQNYLHLSPVDCMLRFLPMSITGITCNLIVALLVGRINGVYLLMIGTAATGCAALLFAIIEPEAPYWQYGFPAAIISVFGADFVFATGTLFIAKVSLPSEQSVAGAIFQTLQQLGVAFGLAISTIAQITATRKEEYRLHGSQGDHSGIESRLFGTFSPEAVLKGYRVAQWTAFSCAGVSLLIVTIFLRNMGVVGARKIKKPIDAVDTVEEGKNSHTQDHAISSQHSQDGDQNPPKEKYLSGSTE